MKGSTSPTSGRDRLLESLWQDARREAEHKLHEAQDEAERLLADSARYREEEIARSMEAAFESAAPAVARILNQARNAIRSRILQTRYAFLESCLQETWTRLTGDGSAREALRANAADLLLQALSGLGDHQELQIRVNAEDEESARAVLAHAGVDAKVVVEEDIAGGARVLVGETGVVDNTVARRLAVLKEEPPLALLRLLDPQIPVPGDP
ncbi:MAG: V-type ATP synthase subunit E [bacterium]|nr:MAG: V-type ATP synthase subunit E [bacterium]